MLLNSNIEMGTGESKMTGQVACRMTGLEIPKRRMYLSIFLMKIYLTIASSANFPLLDQNLLKNDGKLSELIYF